MDITEQLKKEYKEKCNEVRNTSWNKLKVEQLTFIKLQEKISDKVKLLDKEAKKVYNYISHMKRDKDDYIFINKKVLVQKFIDLFKLDMSESRLTKLLKYFVDIGLMTRDKFPRKNSNGFMYKYKVIEDKTGMDDLW